MRKLTIEFVYNDKEQEGSCIVTVDGKVVGKKEHEPLSPADVEHFFRGVVAEFTDGTGPML